MHHYGMVLLAAFALVTAIAAGRPFLTFDSPRSSTPKAPANVEPEVGKRRWKGQQASLLQPMATSCVTTRPAAAGEGAFY